MKLAGCPVTQQFVGMVLAGKRHPSWPTAKGFAAVTETDPVIWLEGTPEEIRAAIEAAERERIRRLNEMADAEAEACAGGF